MTPPSIFAEGALMLSYHIPGSERILEIPIYRCTDEQHRDQEDKDFETAMKLPEVQFFLGGRTPERVKIWQNYRESAYGRAVTLWDFNQIVGWIRLYTWPGNIRAYLFLTRERVTKVMRRKTFHTKRGNFIEMNVFPNQSNAEILEKIKESILAVMAGHHRLRRFYVDMGVLDVLGPHIDWIALTKPPAPPAFDPERFWADFGAAQKRPSI
jgi:hypothetical protein